MVRTGEDRGSGTGEDARGLETRSRIVEAAIVTLKREGFAGTSARAIARTGGFNQALIFYHFGSVRDLLLAALDRTSEARMERYREVIEGARSLPDLMDVAGTVYEEDLDSGHIQVLAEMIAGASSMPELGPQITERMKPWLALTERAVRRTTAGTPLGRLMPPGDAAYAIVALYLGLELLTHLQGDPARTNRLFARGRSVAGKLDRLLRPIASRRKVKGASR